MPMMPDDIEPPEDDDDARPGPDDAERNGEAARPGPADKPPPVEPPPPPELRLPGDGDVSAVPRPSPLLGAGEAARSKRKEIVGLVMFGMYEEGAAEYVGVTVADIHRAAAADQQFRTELALARRAFELRHLKYLDGHCEKSWQVSTWLLERIRPETYARRGPDAYTVEEVDRLLMQLVDYILTVVPDEERRDKIQREVERMIRAFEQRKPGETE